MRTRKEKTEIRTAREKERGKRLKAKCQSHETLCWFTRQGQLA